jgi:homeobox protein cut-like
LSEELVTTQSTIRNINETLTTKTNLIVKLERDIQQLNDMRNNPTSPSENLENLMAPLKSTDSIVPILTSQRDRYRQRFEQSQRSVHELSTKLTTTQDQLSRLQADNVSLYEKLRYQESYRASTSVTMGDDVSTRYRDKYESTIDPFRHFKQVK